MGSYGVVIELVIGWMYTKIQGKKVVMAAVEFMFSNCWYFASTRMDILS